MISRITNLEEQGQIRLIILKLRDTARSWCSEFISEKKWQITLPELNMS